MVVDEYLLVEIRLRVAPDTAAIAISYTSGLSVAHPDRVEERRSVFV